MIRGSARRPSVLDSCLLAAALAAALGACAGSTEPGSNGGQSAGRGGNVGGSAGSAGTGSGTSGSGSGSGGVAAPGGTGGSTDPTGAAGSNAGSGGTSATPGTGGSAAGTTGSAGSSGTTGAGGSAAGGGAAAGRGGSAGATSGRGGGAGATGLAGSVGSAGAAGTAAGGSGAGTTGTGGTAAPAFQKAAGTIPNSPQPASTVNLSKADWQKGILSPSMQNGHQINQPSVLNGYLVIGGNEEFWIHDVSNPAQPKQLSSFTTPSRTGGEAETHTVSYARYGNTFYMVTIGGRGINIWDVTSATAPKHVKAVAVPGTSYGDYTEAIWGVSWQGQYIYVGATNNGIKVIDAANPAAAAIVKEVPTSSYGGVSAGPLDAVGNVLVVTTPKENGGIATLDISDPLNPVRLASITAPVAYIGQFYRHYVFMIGLKSWDVLTNPKSITALGSLGTEGSEYMAFSDDQMFLGHLRTEIGGTPGASKINVADPRSMKITGRVWGRLNLGDKNDDQFVFPMGNLVVIGDDQSPYPGWFIAVHSTEPDTKPPVVDTVIPGNGATAVSTKSRIGISFSDNIELATVNAASFIVRPVGGQPLPGKWGSRMGVVNFDPDQDLQPGTTYEVVLPKGGIADLVGNTITTEWKSTFTTN